MSGFGASSKPLGVPVQSLDCSVVQAVENSLHTGTRRCAESLLCMTLDRGPCTLPGPDASCAAPFALSHCPDSSCWFTFRHFESVYCWRATHWALQPLGRTLGSLTHRNLLATWLLEEKLNACEPSNRLFDREECV